MTELGQHPVPITLITGFLGAGKTTLLNRILQTDSLRRTAVLVNDFGAINIDTQWMVGVEGETVSLANGCICCTIRGDFIAAVNALLRRPDPPDYLIVETSGVSDPLEIALTFRAMHGVRIDSILTVIDAEYILRLDRRFDVLAMNQVGMADIVILNKVDLVDATQLQAVRDYVRSIVPQSRIIETTHADAPVESLLNVDLFDLECLARRAPQAVHVHGADDHDHPHTHEHTDHSLVFTTWSWRSDQPMSYRALRRLVNQLPQSVYRAKGIFFIADDPDRRALLQVVGQRAELTLGERWGTEPARSQFVVIGSAGSLPADTLDQRLNACLADRAPASELEQLTAGVLTWLRGRRRNDRNG